MSDHAQHGQGDTPLPYFDEYLSAVLRPRVERILAREQDEWNHLVWKALIKTILAEQRPGSPITAENLEHLLRDNLGLRIDARVETSFADQPASDGEAGGAHQAPSSGAAQPAEGRVDDDVITRRHLSPLVRAVAGPRRG